jgi:hypothetical protein
VTIAALGPVHVHPRGDDRRPTRGGVAVAGAGGCGRAGWYSHDLLDNLARPSAREILAGLQHLEIGQRVPMAPGVPSETMEFGTSR